MTLMTLLASSSSSSRSQRLSVTTMMLTFSVMMASPLWLLPCHTQMLPEPVLTFGLYDAFLRLQGALLRKKKKRQEVTLVFRAHSWADEYDKAGGAKVDAKTMHISKLAELLQCGIPPSRSSMPAA